VAPTFVSTSQAANTAPATTLAVPFPTGIIAGQVLLLAMCNSNPATYSTPTGFALVKNNSGIAGFGSLYLFSKIAVGSETGNLTVTAGNSNESAGAFVQYSNVAVSPFGASVISVGSSSSTTSPASLTALSPAPAATSMVVRCYGWCQNTSSTGTTITNPGGTWVTRKNFASSVSGQFNAGIVFAEKVNGLDNQVITASNSGAWGVIDIEIKTGAGGSPGPIGKLIHGHAALTNASTV
jgi:hypothetical protein